MYKDNGIDPEGILSTIPSVAHVLIGFLVGKMVINTKDDLRQLMLNLFILGTILTFCGFLLQYGLPINKKVWSPSFVLTTCGLASSALSLMIWLIDIKGWKKWSLYFNSFGVNPLFMYVMGTLLSILLSRLGFQGWLVNDVLIPALGELNGSLAYALLFNVFVWCIGYPLYKNKIYIKI
jgi:predicted acyltransferase